MDPQYPGYIPPNQQQQFYGQPQGFVQQPAGYPVQSQQQCFVLPQQQCYAQQPPQQCYMQQPNCIPPQQQCYTQQPCSPLPYQESYPLPEQQCYQQRQQCCVQPQQQCYMQPQQQQCCVQQQQCCIQPQQCCIQPQQQQCCIQPQQQQCCMQPQQQQCCIQPQQQQCCMQPQQQQFYGQSQQSCSQQKDEYDEPQQDSEYQQTQSRQIDKPQTTVTKINSATSLNAPIAYVNQSWNTSPVQQLTGKPCGDVRPQFYFVFTPDMFTDSMNPWTAEMWLHSFNSLPPEMKIPAKSQSKIEKPESESKISKPGAKQQQQSTQPQRPKKPKKENTRPHIVKPDIHDNQIPLKSESEIFKFQSIAQFQKLRHHATIDSALQQLSELGTDLSFINPNSFNPDPTSCFICCNSYVTDRYRLGVGPVNDAITVAANHKYMGYKVYFIHNQHHTLFLDFLKVFLQKVTDYLTVFFAGHGAQIVDTSGDEADGYDEVMVFDSGYIVDDDLAIYLQKYSLGTAHTILLSDCCHSGTIWDIPEELKKAKKFPANLMSVSSSNDNQTSKQTEIQSNLQGVFTFNLWTLVRNRPSINAIEAKKILTREMRQFNQEFVMYPTRKEMLTKPLFPLMVKHHH